MKKFIILLLIIFVIAFDVFVSKYDKTACEQTLTYRIEFFDHRFGIDEEEFRESIEHSEAVWEVPMALNLFEYDPTAEFTINLVFDERQKATIEKRHLSHKLKQVESSQSNISESYEHWYETYEQKKSSYEKLLSAYDERVKTYNREVHYWNSNGSASRNVYRKLEKEKKNLNSLQVKLEKERDYINEIVEILHSMKDKSNILVDTYKSHIKTYNSLYREYTRFNQGEYDGEAITIYQFNDPADLILVLAHELGHALGLGHVEDPTAVMHYLMGEQDLDALALAPDDINALKTACGLD